ncbi:hypothetical protein SBRY_90006 [Actinacidiphila bryophytorum]|uniref:Uncharacterized protein n=1 Tax=Actinacidiphila bryophytorum TaxID=1436133 RepID=A0A9W4H8C1_9ACTN|nr:hypothetical protein SBRY_90006 [Actinacidiphila bryophytorum]
MGRHPAESRPHGEAPPTGRPASSGAPRTTPAPERRTRRRRTAALRAAARIYRVNLFIAPRVIDRSCPRHYGVR